MDRSKKLRGGVASLVLAVAAALLFVLAASFTMAGQAWAAGNVAEVGGMEYPTLQEAFAVAEDGQEVKLLDDVDLGTQEIALTGPAALSIDLNGKKIASSNSLDAFYFKGVDVTINDSIGGGGVISTTIAFYVDSKSRVTVNSGNISGETYGMYVRVGSSVTLNEGVNVSSPQGTGVFIKGEGSALVVNGATISGRNFGISGNGGEPGKTSVVVNSGIVKATAKVADGLWCGIGIYQPQDGTLEINGGNIEGDLGVQICAGEATISGTPTITATGPDVTAQTSTGNTVPNGAAVSVINRPGYPSIPSLAITGSPTIIAAAGEKALYVHSWSNDTVSEWVDAGDYVRVSGGCYSSPIPEELCADHYYPVDTPDPVTGLYAPKNTHWVTCSYAGDIPSSAPSLPEPFELPYGEPVALDSPALVLGYTFSGWKTPDGESAGSLVMGDADIELVGTWTADKAIIAFEPNGGTPCASIEGVTNGAVSGTLPQPTREGYAFEGWYESPDFSGDQVLSLPSVFAAGETKYYAKWSKANLVEPPATNPVAPGGSDKPTTDASASANKFVFAKTNDVAWMAIAGCGIIALAAAGLLYCARRKAK